MKVDYIFSSNSKIGSKLISWGSSLFKEHVCNLNDVIPSHVGVLIEDQFVVESVLTEGIRLVPYTKWLEINNELYKVPAGNKTKQEIDSLKCGVKNMTGLEYFILQNLCSVILYLNLRYQKVINGKGKTTSFAQSLPVD
jgi:hypothetical protein